MLPWNYLSLGKFVSLTFSNSLIIHAEKTKEITTVKEVWICDLNYHKIWWTFALIFSKNYEWFEELYQTLERVFHPLRLDFSTTSQCLDIGWNTLPRVWCNIWAPRCTGEAWYLWEGANALSQLVFWYLYPFREKREWSRRLYITQYTRKNLFNSFVSFLFTLCPTAGSDLFTTVRIKHSTSETFWSFHVVTDLFCSFLIISSFSFHPFSLPSFLFYPLHRLLQQPSLVSFPAVSSRTMPRRKFLSK